MKFLFRKRRYLEMPAKKTKGMTMEQRIEADVRDINAKAKETQFLSTGVSNMDGTYEEDYFPVTHNDLHMAALRIIEKNPTLSFMLIACGTGPIAVKPPTDEPSADTTPCCLVYVHSAVEMLNAASWLMACFSGPFMHGTGPVCPYDFKQHDCEYPIKEKDLIISNSCNYLRKLGLIQDEDEEPIPFDINAD
uniref:Uncharacterized protein n=1 Tax=viral metagenome TaxID=1070528 RepID=A0A6C0JU35_9ZZZZ